MKQLYRFVSLGLLFIFIGNSNSVQAQDTHFSQFFLHPTAINPAATGAFYGTYRVSGIYRSQWNTYTTPGIGVDLPLMRGFNKLHWVGLGLAFESDQAGVGQLGRTSYLLGASYNIGLDKKYDRVFTFGVQGGFLQRSINNPNEYVSPGQLSGGSGINLTEAGSGGIDINAGILYRAKVNKLDHFTFGIAAQHISQPNTSVVSDDDYREAIRFLGHFDYHYQMSQRLYIEPAALVQLKGNAFEANVNAIFGYKINPERPLVLRAGLGYRILDAAEVYLGADYKKLRFGLSYDLALSSLLPKSALELGITYTGIIYKRPKVERTVFCPKY